MTDGARRPGAGAPGSQYSAAMRGGRRARQYFTLQPYGVVLAVVTGLPASVSASAART